MSADVTALKRGKGGNSFPLHSFKNEKTKTRRETIRRVKVTKKSPRKGVDTVLRVFRAKRFIYLHDSRYNKIIEMQYFM